jgi:Prolyl oligopeptidase, N-terminal beta-propeller domain
MGGLPAPVPAPPAGPASGGPDPYAWMRDRDLPAMRAYLAAERAYYDRWLESVRGLRDELAAELAARMIPAEDSVSRVPRRPARLAAQGNDPCAMGRPYVHASPPQADARPGPQVPVDLAGAFTGRAARACGRG